MTSNIIAFIFFLPYSFADSIQLAIQKHFFGKTFDIKCRTRKALFSLKLIFQQGILQFALN